MSATDYFEGLRGVSTPSMDDANRYREYIANQHYRMRCNVAGVVPQSWLEIGPAMRDAFRAEADLTVEGWRAQLFPPAKIHGRSITADFIRVEDEVVENMTESIGLQVAREIARRKDKVIYDELEKRLGARPIPENMVSRLTRVKDADGFTDTYFLDGKPLIKFWGCETRVFDLADGRHVKIAQNYQLFPR